MILSARLTIYVPDTLAAVCTISTAFYRHRILRIRFWWINVMFRSLERLVSCPSSTAIFPFEQLRQG
jgi:hypothetical protein